MELFSIYQLIKLDIRYISKTDTALQFYTTKLTDYSVERRRLVMAILYTVRLSLDDIGMFCRASFQALLSTVLGSQHKWHSLLLHKIFSIHSDFYTNQVN